MLLVLALSLLCTALSAQISFVPNEGQWDDNVEFRAEFNGGVLWAEQSSLCFLLLNEDVNVFNHENLRAEDLDPRGHMYRMRFVDALQATHVGKKPESHFLNYYLGNDHAKWAQGVYPFKQASYEHIYEGISMLLYSKGPHIKYDLKLEPGADPTNIRMVYEGAESLKIKGKNLVIGTSLGPVIEQEPYAYQLIDGKLVEVECEFVVQGQEVTFELGDYDPNATLIIDPEISFASYIGSSASNFGFTATDDADGNLIAGACVFQAGYPTTLGAIQTTWEFMVNGYCDIAVSKFSADGSQLLYSTYMGGSGLEMPHSIITDSNGDYIVMGTTGSGNFPTTFGSYQPSLNGGPPFSFSSFFVNASHQEGCDFFVAKFNGDDSGLMASTFVGGYGTDGLNVADKLFYNYGDSFRGEVIVDDQDRIIVASNTQSSEFPMVGNQPQSSLGGGSDGIVFRMSADLSTLQWSSYLGGINDDAAYSVQTDSNGILYVCGGAKSVDFPVADGYDTSHNGDVDAFLVKINTTSGDIEAGTFLGTNDYDQAYFVQLDLQEEVYIIGQTTGDFPINGSVYSNAGSGQFLAKFNNDLNDLIWSTTIGTGSGEVDVSPTAFLVSDCDQIYWSGWGGLTNSANSNYAFWSTTQGLPITSDAYQNDTDGSDFYLCVLSPDAASLDYATYFGGDISREHVDGGTSKFDKDGSVYQAVCAGCGGNDDFPSTPGSWSTDNGSSNCNLGVFKFDLASINAEIQIDGPTEVCEGEPAQFLNYTTGGSEFQWFFGDGTSSTAFEPEHIFESDGTFQIMLVAMDENDCLSSDTAYIEITVLTGVSPQIEEVEPICNGASVQLFGSGSENLFWLPDPTLSATDMANPVATPNQTTTYYLVDFNACETDTVSITVTFVIPETDVTDDTVICIGQSTTLTASGGVDYVWSPVTGLASPGNATTTAAPEETTTYTVTITTEDGCVVEESTTITVETDPPGGTVYPTVNLCIGLSAQLQAANGFSWEWSPTSTLDNPFVQFPMASPLQTTLYTVVVTNACGTGEDEVTVEVIVPEVFAGNNGTICLNEWHPVWAEGAESYAWVPALWVQNWTGSETFVSPPENTTFTVYGTDEFGCVATAQVDVNVLPLPYVDAGPDQVVEWLDPTNLYGTSDEPDFWWSETDELSCTDCLNPQIFPEASGWYVLNAVDANGCVNRDSVFVEVFMPVYVPNTFTPDGDGLNDVFKAYGENLQNFRMEIRNRWGDLIFESNDPDHVWNGSVDGGEYLVQIDTYLWTIWFDSIEGRTKLVGHVTVLR
jgi:gliding motility-associated-like protein